MAVALDQAYILAEEAIERTDVDSFKEILKEFPNLDIYIMKIQLELMELP